MHLRCGSRTLDLSAPAVMGVLNVTPDSFSDGGRFSDVDAAVRRGHEMAREGAALIDVGGESTRPGAEPVPEQQEIDRVVPVIERLRRELDCILSVDTLKPAVMRAACAAGAEVINDVNALRAPGALDAARATPAAVILMHMQGEPRTMQRQPRYDDVVREVGAFLRERAAAAIAAGIGPERIALDPGIGFGKTLDHNLALLGALAGLAPGHPLVVGVSRKSMFRALLGRELPDRLPGGLAAAAIAVWQGAAIVRAHDVAATVDAVRLAHAIRSRQKEGA